MKTDMDANVWQKTKQYYKAIILQLIVDKLKKIDIGRNWDLILVFFAFQIWPVWSGTMNKIKP